MLFVRKYIILIYGNSMSILTYHNIDIAKWYNIQYNNVKVSLLHPNEENKYKEVI
jgi:hypothetical protein